MCDRRKVQVAQLSSMEPAVHQPSLLTSPMAVSIFVLAAAHRRQR